MRNFTGNDHPFVTTYKQHKITQNNDPAEIASV